MSSRIEDYAMVADGRSVALIDKHGAVNWLCWPSMDSRAVFCALLGNRENGYWLIRPKSKYRSTQRYIDNTLILETEFQTTSGSAVVTDWLALGSPEQILFRRVECRKGRIDMKMELVPSFDYGSFIPWIERSAQGVRATAGPDSVELRSSVDLELGKGQVTAAFRLKAGEFQTFALIWEGLKHRHSAVISDATKSFKHTRAEWIKWSRQSTYNGPYRELVMRSLLTLKGLVDRSTGGMVAAATTSLPETLGGVRNWDYRFCWIRDATYTLYSFLSAGYKEEAQAWRHWLVRAAAGAPHQLNIMYGIRGERRLPELELDWLSGYQNSRPVRIGNAAYKQRQLDIFGELMDTLHLSRRSGIEPDHTAWAIQRELITYLEEAWQKPDEGVWEMRGPPRHFTHSKAMAWLAFDRAIRAVETFDLPGDLPKWQKIRAQIHDQVCRRGFNKSMNTFTQHFGSKSVDASLLLLAHIGFLPPTDPRIVGTVERIESELMRSGFVLRYKAKSGLDGLPGNEGVFLPCSFWLVDAYQLMGEHEKAHLLFRRLTKLANHVGLFSEEYDPRQKRFMGNFPQALTHMSLINSAFNLYMKSGPAHDRSGSASRTLETSST